MIFNDHSHINDYTDEEIESCILHCQEKGITDICAVGYDISSSRKALELAKKYSFIHAICGLQPEEVEKFNGNYEEFITLFDDERCVAIGEIGLDYYYCKDNKALQIECFEKQLQIASNYKKPIQIHCRDAHQDTFDLLYKYKNQLDGIILHCYSGSVEMMKRYVDLGAYISISGVVTFKNAKEIKEVVKACPIERLLVETDDPFLTPVPYRGQKNEPANVYYVVSEIASLKGLSIEEVADITYQNAKKVFHL